MSGREATLAEFEDYLRTVNSREGRPYEEKTISNYTGPGKNLDRWMTASGIDGDFTVLDTVTLNRYFREYYLEHGQGGTHTLQRNLIQLFNFLEHERDHPSPYGDSLNRYAAVKGRPKTLDKRFIDDLLDVTGGGRARDFETAREHAIIRILRSEGIRRAELLGMVMHTLPADAGIGIADSAQGSAQRTSRVRRSQPRALCLLRGRAVAIIFTETKDEFSNHPQEISYLLRAERCGLHACERPDIPRARPASGRRSCVPANGRPVVMPRQSRSESDVKRALTPKRSKRLTENDEYLAFLRRVVRGYGRRVAAGDIDALPGLAAMGEELDAAMQHSVNGLRAAGYSWAEIAARLGITRQGAQQRWSTGGRE